MAASGRHLSLVNMHTGESLAVTYWRGGGHVPAACRRISRLLRDHRTGEVAPISTDLFDLLHALRRRLATDAPFHVVSGYRSPETNAMLARASGRVARRSLHMEGLAIDVRVPGCAIERLHAEAVALRRGGVGLYRKSKFIHVDVGPVRYW